MFVLNTLGIKLQKKAQQQAINSTYTQFHRANNKEYNGDNKNKKETRMHIKIETEKLQKNLELSSRVSTKHVTLSVLQCVLLEAKNEKLTIKATNLELGIEAILTCEIEEEGLVAVPASTLLQTVNLVNQKEVTLRVEDGTLVVESLGSETHIKTIPFDEFPNIPKLEGEGQVINNQLFNLGIKHTVFAASVSSIKPELGSVYIYQKKEHTLTFVATDSFRLMEKTVPQKGVVLDNSVLIPHKNALELSRICELKEENPILRISENQCSIEFPDGFYLTSRLVNGSFPDYEQIIPKEYVTHSTVLKNDLVKAFKKTNIFLNKFLQVSLHVTDKSITVSANSGELGTTTESLPAQTDGDDIVLNFNQRYINEALSHFVDDSIVLNFAGVGRPMVIKGVSEGSVRYLVMPMNK